MENRKLNHFHSTPIIQDQISNVHVQYFDDSDPITNSNKKSKFFLFFVKMLVLESRITQVSFLAISILKRNGKLFCILSRAAIWISNFSWEKKRKDEGKVKNWSETYQFSTVLSNRSQIEFPSEL